MNKLVAWSSYVPDWEMLPNKAADAEILNMIKGILETIELSITEEEFLSLPKDLQQYWRLKSALKGES